MRHINDELTQKLADGVPAKAETAVTAEARAQAAAGEEITVDRRAYAVR